MLWEWSIDVKWLVMPLPAKQWQMLDTPYKYLMNFFRDDYWLVSKIVFLDLFHAILKGCPLSLYILLLKSFFWPLSVSASEFRVEFYGKCHLASSIIWFRKMNLSLPINSLKCVHSCLNKVFTIICEHNQHFYLTSSCVTGNCKHYIVLNTCIPYGSFACFDLTWLLR